MLSHVLQSLKTDSCLEYKCLLEVVGQSVSDYNEVAVLYREFVTIVFELFGLNLKFGLMGIIRDKYFYGTGAYFILNTTMAW